MDNKEIRRQNLLLLIDQAGGQKALGINTGIAPSMFSQVSNRTRGMGDSLARRLENAISRPLGWMDTIHTADKAPPKPASHDAEWIGGMDLWDGDTPLREDEVELPLFREVELAAGSGCTQVIENHGAKLRFARSTLSNAGVQASSAACVRVSGNSMEPVLPHGTTVGIDTGTTTVKDGKMYAIDHGGLLRVKLLYRLPGGGIKLRSYSRDEHPDEDLAGEGLEHFRIIGRVFWYSVLL